MAAGSLTSPAVWTLRAAQPEEREIVSDKRVVWHCGFPASHVTKLRIDSASQVKRPYNSRSNPRSRIQRTKRGRKKRSVAMTRGKRKDGPPLGIGLHPASLRNSINDPSPLWQHDPITSRGNRPYLWWLPSYRVLDMTH